MVTSRLISGLGNQLFQYAVGRQLSLIRNVDLALDTSFFSGQNLRSYRLCNFDIKATVLSVEEIKAKMSWRTDNSLFSKIHRQIEHYRPKYKKCYFKESEWWVYEPELFKTSGNVYIDGYWQHYKYFTDLHPQVLAELTVKESYPAAVEEVVKRVSTGTSVAVHVRRGDYVSNPEAHNFMGVMPISYYVEAMNYCRSKIENPRFYFFSDDLAWVKQNLLLSDDSELINIENGADYIDLDIMSKCAHNIIANSSFSWWSAFLNKNPCKIVIAPKQWVVSPEVNSRIELAFPSWIQL